MLVTGDRRLVHGAGVVSRAGNESSQRLKFHNHGEGPLTRGSPQLKVPLAFSYALNVNAIVGTFNQKEILVRAFSVKY